ncbi:hypothetical protein HOLleu_02086 [Holothuria leucospilota]|uniref:Secreted protein n=1 Tax=Holothuria leucospilota TaxID=206669 RepID=A0A9Q1CRA2_HOLLE|nr:hypothetical protein HOLleu_02086 [Holothuria leucospilota]
MKIVLSQRITYLVTFAVVLGQTYALSTNACVFCNCSQEETMYVVNCSQKMFEEVPRFIPSNVGYL